MYSIHKDFLIQSFMDHFIYFRSFVFFLFLYKFIKFETFIKFYGCKNKFRFFFYLTFHIIFLRSPHNLYTSFTFCSRLFSFICFWFIVLLPLPSSFLFYFLSFSSSAKTSSFTQYYSRYRSSTINSILQSSSAVYFHFSFN